MNCARFDLRGACARLCLPVYPAITAILLIFHAMVGNVRHHRHADAYKVSLGIVIEHYSLGDFTALRAWLLGKFDVQW